MMKYSVDILFLLAAIGTTTVDSIDEDMTSISYNTVETFLTTNRAANHMEIDLLVGDGSILFSKLHSLSTTDGVHTKSLLNLPKASISGFYQINSTHIALGDKGLHCLRLFNRDNGQLKVLAGTFSKSGYADGPVRKGRLNSPRGITADITNPGRLLVTDITKNSLRSVDIQTGELGTVIKSGFNQPSTIVWKDESLLVLNMNYISMVSWLQNGTVINTKLAGSIISRKGEVDGSFDVATFSSLRDIVELAHNIYLIASGGSASFRLMNMKSRMIGPVCTKGEMSCNVSSHQNYSPSSLLKVGNDVLVGSSLKIEKFSAFTSTESKLSTHTACPDNNITVTIRHGKETADVVLHCGNTAVLYAGIHEFKTKNNSNGCSYYVQVINTPPVIRTLVFKAEYKVNCSELEDDATRNVLQSELEQRSNQLQKICDKNCTMSSTKQPWFDCKGNLLTAYWPTEDALAADILVPPKNLNSLLEERLDELRNMCNEIAVIFQKDPFVDAEENAEGETIQLALISSCSDDSLTFDSHKDACVQKDA